MRQLLLAAVVMTPAWAGSAWAQDAKAGQFVFKTQCAGCHSGTEGRNLVGPSLYGIIGRKAGQVPNFRYSPANKASNVIWDAATMDPYLASPQAVVPKTIMVYAGLKDAKKRADVIAYLETLHP
jgi:cytochrome c